MHSSKITTRSLVVIWAITIVIAMAAVRDNTIILWHGIFMPYTIVVTYIMFTIIQRYHDNGNHNLKLSATKRWVVICGLASLTTWVISLTLPMVDRYTILITWCVWSALASMFLKRLSSPYYSIPIVFALISVIAATAKAAG